MFWHAGDDYAATFPESSSDSEEDVLRRLRQHQQQQQQRHLHSYPVDPKHELIRTGYHPHHHVGAVVARGSPSQMSTRSISLDSQYHHHSHHPSQSMHPMAQQRSFDHGTSSHLPTHQQQAQLVSNVVTSSHHGHHSHHPLHHPIAPSPSSSFTSQSVRPLRVSGIREVVEDVINSSSRRRPHSKGKAYFKAQNVIF